MRVLGRGVRVLVGGGRVEGREGFVGAKEMLEKVEFKLGIYAGQFRDFKESRAVVEGLRRELRGYNLVGQGMLAEKVEVGMTPEWMWRR